MARPEEARFALGLDFGTQSVRALIADVRTGEELATAVCEYPSGETGVIVDAQDPNLARQNPADYIAGFERSVAAALAAARARRGFDPALIAGLGVDTTGSTPLPVDRQGVPLALSPEFAREPAAQAWLWKDHTAFAEAEELTQRARAGGRPYLAKCGGAYSSEWYWSKILRCERAHPEVARHAFGWVELCDFVPGWLTGRTDPLGMSRSICAAGHKALYHESWGGLPAAEFLDELAPGLSRYRERFAARALPADRRAGELVADIARRAGLPPGLPVAVGALDAHMGAVGAGVGPGTLLKIMGTSTCDCMVAPLDSGLPDIPGLCGIVPESIVPGMYGLEAGQSAVGDIFEWFAARIAPAGSGRGSEAHRALSEAAALSRPGASGLLALDWHNGNRTVLVDPLLTGLVLGLTLHTTPPEIYRALVESTAFGALKIIERLEQYGVPVERVVCCGGIAEKNPLVMQIYADVFDRPLAISRATQSCALGASIFGAVVGGAHASVPQAQAAMTGVRPEVFRPRPDAVAVYRQLYALYSTLHDAFGLGRSGAELGRVMKDLIAIRSRARAGA